MRTVNSFKAVGGFRKVRSSRVTAHQPQVVVPVRLNRPINPLIRCFLSETSKFRPSSPPIPFLFNVQRTRLPVSFRFVSFLFSVSTGHIFPIRKPQTWSDSFLFRFFPVSVCCFFSPLARVIIRSCNDRSENVGWRTIFYQNKHSRIGRS